MNTFLSRACDGLASISSAHRPSAAGRLGILFTAVGPDFLCAEMPVDERTRQPFGILHGGASMLLAETVGSVASWLLVRGDGGQPAGIDISGSHLRSVRSGIVTAVCTPLRIATRLHFWRIAINNADGEACCEARLTVSILWPRDQARSR